MMPLSRVIKRSRILVIQPKVGFRPISPRALSIYLLLLPLTVSAINRQGIFYYEKPKQEKQQTEPETFKFKDSTDLVNNLNQQYQERLNTSILYPTKDNIIAERKMAAILMDLAERYQTQARVVINHTPELNYSLRHPVNHLPRIEHDARKREQDEKQIHELGKTHGLFFFYSTSCPHCREFASTVKRFANRYNFSVLPISLDSKILPEFPDSQFDQGQAEQLKVMSLPALYMVNTESNELPILISYGNVSVMELTENIILHHTNRNQGVQYEVLN